MKKKIPCTLLNTAVFFSCDPNKKNKRMVSNEPHDFRYFFCGSQKKIK
jgi:hypothetical protein